jgi:hypothetical protein
MTILAIDSSLDWYVEGMKKVIKQTAPYLHFIKISDLWGTSIIGEAIECAKLLSRAIFCNFFADNLSEIGVGPSKIMQEESPLPD